MKYLSGDKNFMEFWGGPHDGRVIPDNGAHFILIQTADGRHKYGRGVTPISGKQAYIYIGFEPDGNPVERVG